MDGMDEDGHLYKVNFVNNLYMNYFFVDGRYPSSVTKHKKTYVSFLLFESQ